MKRSFRYTFWILTTLFSLLLWDCKKPTEPPPPSGIDTTSHNFTWRIDTLGDGNSSVLNDVAIIDENNIWAVGEIYLKDSSGQIDPTAHGFARWNGSKWNFLRLEAIGPTGAVSNLVPRGIFAFSPTEIWFASGGVFRWNGATVTPYWINPFPGNPNPILSEGQTAEKLWGTSSSNMYAVGRTGAIAHFNGSSWQKIESGTMADFRDISGTSSSAVLAIASSPELTKISSLTPQSANDTLAWPSTERSRGIWISPRKKVYVSAFGVWRHDSTGWTQMQGIPQEFYTDVNGSDENNIFAVSWAGRLTHYNGATWLVYSEVSSAFNFEAVAVSENAVAIVGFLNNGRAVAVVGKANQ